METKLDVEDPELLLSKEIKHLEDKAMAELETLSPLCNVEFKCCLLLGSSGEGDSSKKMKLVATKLPKKKKQLHSLKQLTVATSEKDSRTELTELYIEFEWIGGDDKDMLHQMVQFFQNKFGTGL